MRGLCTEPSHTLLRKSILRTARHGLRTLRPGAEQAAWTRSQRQAASSCGALRMATTSQRSSKSKVGHAEFAKARSLPAFAEPLEPGLQEVTGGMTLQTALKGPRPAMLQSAESGASGRPPSSDTSRMEQKVSCSLM